MPEIRANGQIIVDLLQQQVFWRCVDADLEPVAGLGADWTGTNNYIVLYRRFRNDGTSIDTGFVSPSNANAVENLGEGWYRMTMDMANNELQAPIILWSIKDGISGSTFKSLGPYMETYAGSGNLGGLHRA